MTLRRIYLINSLLTGALGIAICVRGIALRELSSGFTNLGVACCALAVIIYAVAKHGDLHFLRIAAWRFSAAHMLIIFPLLVDVMRQPSRNVAWILMLVAFYLMSQAFTFESLIALRPWGCPPLALDIRGEWQEQIRQDAAQQERNRLAQDLHDSVKQQLFSIQTNLATAQARWETDTPAVQAAIVQARDAVREASAEIAAMLDQLQPSPLETIGLVEALRRQSEALAHRSGAEVRTSFHDLPSFDADTERVVYRIGQEALANVGRHARARKVELELGIVEGKETVLRIHDDGQGLGNSLWGLGLRTMRQRAAEIGGKLTVDSPPGQGTTVELRLRPAAYATDLSKRHRKQILVHGITMGVFVLVIITGFGSLPMAWFWISMGIVEGAVTAYHTKKYLDLKGRAA